MKGTVLLTFALVLGEFHAYLYLAGREDDQSLCIMRINKFDTFLSSAQSLLDETTLVHYL